MAEQKATNIHWHEGEVTRDERAGLLGHRGATPVSYTHLTLPTKA